MNPSVGDGSRGWRLARVRNVLVISALATIMSLAAATAAVSDVFRDDSQSSQQTPQQDESLVEEPGGDTSRSSTSRAAAVATEPTVDDTPSFSSAPPATNSQQSVPVPPQGEPPVAGGVVAPTPEPRGQAPVGLRIPGIGVDAGVQWVGVDENGDMMVPSNYDDVAWYEPGPRPGERGNAVINGHFDSTTGPAVFWDLGQLQPGDEVIVRTHGDQELRFIVTAIESYKTEEAPLTRIFGPTSERNLNLITCDGTFLQDIRQYDRRLVVYTVLAEGQTVQPEG